MIDTIIHVALLLVFPPLLLGVINKTKALYAGRVGAPFLQPYFDITKLLRKGMVLSSTTTWIFRAAPVVTLASVIAAGLMVPLGSAPPLVAFTGDFLLFSYLFALARFFTTGAALDTGSAFEGMGAAREVTFAALTEPATFFAFLVLSRLTGSLSLGGMLGAASAAGAVGSAGFAAGSVAPLVMIAIGLFIVLLAENSRIPVDDPNTHLELTMIHEVMILDHSGPLLGIIEYASSMKFLILGSVLLDVVMPESTRGQWVGWLVYLGGMLGLSFIVGTIESIMGRLRMIHVPILLIAAILVCGSAFIMVVR
jgi:formate hydrogenlyase subunit 4